MRKNMNTEIGSAIFLTILFLQTTVFAHELQYQSISAQEAYECSMEDEEAIILDVRSPEEYEELHIKGAVLLPLDELEVEYRDVLPDPEQMILIYCRSGRRSKIAAEYLTEEGYRNVYEFGGLSDWEYETETGVYCPARPEGETEASTDGDAECKHQWLEDCVGKTCSKCGEYLRYIK